MTKTKKIIMLMLAVLCAVTFGGSVYCYARYVFERGNNGTVTPGKDIPVSVLNRVVVDGQETLFEALESGYPYITIGDNVSSPLVITEPTMTVKKSLILDVNGKEIQRIGESAMLEIGEGVTLTIIDTSAGQKGNLYNPVGTVLEVKGGTLDVRAGKFESGPRTWEYFSNPDIRKKIDTHDKVNYYTRNSAEKMTKQLPIITPTVQVDANKKPTSVDGNIYYDKQYTSKDSDLEALADTYCFYNTSDNFSTGQTVPFDKTVADFFYSYYARAYNETNGYAYLSDTETGAKQILGTDAKLNEDYVLVTIYGFRHVIQTAMGFSDGCPNGADDIGKVDTGKAPYYAAVKMSAGKITIKCDAENKNLKAPYHSLAEGVRTEESPDLKNDAGSGSFISYFGVETTACVYFTGGVTSIKTKGAFATVDPKIIKEDLGSADAFSSEGRGICVYGSAKGGDGGGTLDIDGGHFYAYNHNLVRMEKGKIDVDGDSKEALQLFKVHRVSFYRGFDLNMSSTEVDALHRTGKGGIFSSGGIIDIGIARIYMTSGRLTPAVSDGKDITTYTSKQGIYGVYATGGTVNMKDVDIYVRGQGCAGVSVSGDENGGGHVVMDGTTPTRITTPEQIAERDQYYSSFDKNVKDDIHYLYESNIFLIGYNTKGVLVSGNGSVTAKNTAIFVSRAQGAAMATTFLSGVDIIEGSGKFTNCRIQSDGYGVTMTRGTLVLNGSRLSAYNASAVILGGGNMVINSDADLLMNKTTINCKLTQAYIDRAKGDGFVGTLHAGNKDILYTYAGIDIIGGKMSVASGELEYTFDSDKETPEMKDRIDRATYADAANSPSLIQNDIYEEIYDSGKLIGVKCMGPNGFLPAESNAIRVIGSQASGSDIDPASLNKALEITADCKIVSKMGGGITIRGGDVVLGSAKNETISVTTEGKESYGMKKINNKDTAYWFADKDNWAYLDNKTGGDAMFVSGGHVTANTSKLTLVAAHGNGLLVTGSGCIKKWYEKYNGEAFNDYLFAYDLTAAAINPTVTIHSGTFEGRCDGFAKKSDKSGLVRDFGFTGPSSYYGVKVVCGGELIVKGGNISGYGGICTMGSVKGDLIHGQAELRLEADYRDQSNRIGLSCTGADVGAFYNNSAVNIISTDKTAENSSDHEDAKVKVATDADHAVPEKLDDFGLVVYGKNTCFVIEKRVYEGDVPSTIYSSVKVNGGFYCATKGDDSGGKAFWCDNNTATLTIENGWFIGTLGGGAVQKNLKSCVINGGHFINDGVKRGSGGWDASVFTGGIKTTLGSGKAYYKIDTSGTYYTVTENEGSESDSAVYVGNKKA